MTLTYHEAAAAICAPGERFETAVVTLDGVETTAFVNAPATLRDIFDTARARGDDPFMVYEDETWTFARTMTEIDALAATLATRYGVSKGDRVALSMRNFPEWVVTWAAALSVGAVAVSLNAWWTEEEVDFALGDSTPKVFVGDAERIERAHAPCIDRGIAMVSVRSDSEVAGVDAWVDVVLSGTTPPHVDLDGGDDATILYTSGTTGHPKGAVSTHRAVTQALWGFFARTALDRARGAGRSAAGRPVFILVVPLFHVTGCVPVMLSCFANGLKLVMMRKWDPERALELIEREAVTSFVGVPTQSWDMLRSPRFAETDTSSLVGVGGGGAPAPPELVRQVAGSFSNATPTIGYGMTETNAYGPQNSGTDYLEHPTSTGRATPILQIEARDESGRSLGAGEVGELWMHGPTLVRGYWNNPEATSEAIVDGWLRTGDIGRVDEEGFVFISDRAKDMVLRGGENVYCAEVENVLYEHPEVREAAVFGIPHERLGEQVVAVVHLDDAATVDGDALRDFVAVRLAPFKVPEVIDVADRALPRNAAGKILKRSLRDGLHSS